MSGELHLIGGEMPGWSDRRAGARPPAGGPLLVELAHRVGALLPPGGRLLVAGPHDDALVDALSTYGPVSCLLRGEPDARAAAERGITTLCGSLAKLDDSPGYDAVVALDGLDRLCSVEEPQLGWDGSRQVLQGVLRPGGILLLAVENELGVHRLVDPHTATSAHAGATWQALGEFGTTPGNPARLAGRLAADGLTVSWQAAAWPLPSAPTLIATAEALGAEPAGALSAAAARAVARAYAGRLVLSDPRRLAAAAVHAGLGAALAPCWLVVAHREPRSAPAFAGPSVLLGDGPVTEVARGAEGLLPAGRLLEELLLGALLRHDLPVVRRLLTGWVGWLGTLAPTDRAAATADNVLVDGETYRLIDPGAPAAAVGTPAAAAGALRRFARTVLTGGYAHPWPAVADEASLTAVLAGAAGLDEEGTDPAPAGATPAPVALREHHEQLGALRRQLADATDLAQWYREELDRRDGELRRARLQIDAFSGTLPYRLTRLAVRLLRRVRR
ncbi:methyltransferase domain-containing protein [Couchioplanes azureus]|uniref:hypothetical protein n=1 Tax=Couchioplanes caeruleus TaxID=56438 RepID=UPI00167071DD|nr:hypothetical protein [Couchioplanes caeruleus]GGQ74809.1 hypothetical protein GCM10010166_50940 [Couchioplanes caeruleus subsp. azureus]